MFPFIDRSTRRATIDDLHIPPTGGTKLVNRWQTSRELTVVTATFAYVEAIDSNGESVVIPEPRFWEHYVIGAEPITCVKDSGAFGWAG